MRYALPKAAHIAAPSLVHRSPLCTATATPLARHIANRALRKAGDSAPLSLPSLTGGLRLRDAGAAAPAAAGAAGGGGSSGGAPQQRVSSGGIGDGTSPRPPTVTSVRSMREASPRMRRATTLDVVADHSPASISSGGSGAPLSPNGPSAAAISAPTSVGEGGALSPSGVGGGSGGRPERFHRLHSLPASNPAFGSISSGALSPPGSSAHYSGPTAQFSSRDEPAFTREEDEVPPSTSGPLPTLSAGPSSTSPRDREVSVGSYANQYHHQQQQLAGGGSAPHPPPLTHHNSSHSLNQHMHGPSHLRPMPAPLLSPQPQASTAAAAAAADARRAPQNRRRSEMSMLVVPAPETPLPRLKNAATAAASIIADSNTVGRQQLATEAAGHADFYVDEGEPGMEGIEEGEAEGAGATAAGGSDGDEAIEDLLPTRPEPLRAATALSVQVPLSPPSAGLSVAASAGSAGSEISAKFPGPGPASNTSLGSAQMPAGVAAAASAFSAGSGSSTRLSPVVSPGTECIASLGPAPPFVMTSPTDAKAPPKASSASKDPSLMDQSHVQSPERAAPPAAAPPHAVQTKLQPQAATAGAAASGTAAPVAGSGALTPRSPYTLPVPGAFVSRPVPKDGRVHLSSAAPPAMSLRSPAAWGVGDFKIVRKLYAGYASSVYKVGAMRIQ